MRNDKKKINACLGWHIRHGKGFYYKGKKYLGIAYHSDCLEVHNNDVASIAYIPYENITSIKTVKVDGDLQKTIFTVV